MATTRWIPLEPTLSDEGLERLTSVARRLAKVDPMAAGGAARDIDKIREAALTEALKCDQGVQAVRVCMSVLCDLRGQGWDIGVRKGTVRVALPDAHDDAKREKARVRAGLLVERDRQLRKESVRAFIADMERRRIGPDGDWVSVFSVMRDGQDLACSLNAVASIEDDDHREARLRELIQPYIQVVDDSVCEHTGLPLKEIWRYFRHTWSSPHKNLPGRTIWYLVRDAAAPNHPIIGIAALGSSVVQLRIRDEWIGWRKQEFLARLRAEPTSEWAQWVHDRLNTQLNELFTEDLANELAAEHLIPPAKGWIRRLREIATAAREEHRLYGNSRDHKHPEKAGSDWESRARTPLFTSKRASRLADILEDFIALEKTGFGSPTPDGLQEALSEKAGRRAIGRILRRVKAARVGIDILDITVCGAVAPYNHILGGKLVSLLLTSPEVRKSYRERYSDRASVIASSMAGRAIKRDPSLVLLGTTSLYGVGSSQYNRLQMPTEEVGGPKREEIQYQERGVTEGYGSIHFSSPTLDEIRTFCTQRGNGRRVKHIFGEGANPRMREVRDAFDQIGLPSDRLLRHENHRVVYTIPLASNFRDVLIDKDHAPNYLVPEDDPDSRTADIVAFWTRRWLSNRIQKERIIHDVSRHSTAYPVGHGARVTLPPTHEDMPLVAYAPDD